MRSTQPRSAGRTAPNGHSEVEGLKHEREGLKYLCVDRRLAIVGRTLT